MDHRSSEQRRNNGGTTWLTCDEVAFIQRLGTHNEDSSKTSCLTWLQRYIAAAERRVEWGKIDKAAVIQEAKKLVRAELRKVGREKAA